MSRFILTVKDTFDTTIALIEHDMGVVMDLSDRVVVLDYGRQDRRRNAGGSAGQPGGHRRLSGRQPLRSIAWFSSARFCEVLIGGLLSGVLYSLVALGFVLIFKASGVFNFAQGAMVLLAGLALVRSLDFLVARGVPDVGGHHAGACCLPRVIMAITAWLIERFVLGPARQPGRPHALHVDHRRDLHPRRRLADDLRLRRLSRCGCSPPMPGSCSRALSRAASWSTSSMSGAA